MKALFVEHDHTSPPGPIGEAFARRGYEIDEMVIVSGENYYSPNVEFTFPSLDEYDVLVPMGAPWGAWDDATIGNWLVPELEWLREADRRGVPVLGICFGGQLLARAHGGSVGRAPSCEIGWSVLHTDEPDLVSAGPWFQFHYDRWELPPDAHEIARTSRASQAFTLRRNLALQFHPELTPHELQLWLDTDGYAHVERDGQNPEALMAHTRAEESAASKRADALVGAFLERVAPA
jgi:GMP synthase-like glutamine amidotransferase